jgi:GTPase
MQRLILFGHVDHGKSTLAGHLLHLTGNFDDHEVEKASRDADGLKMSRWKWAYLLDTCSEERAKGKTHEYSVFPFKYASQDYELIDTPGHQTFVRETIAALGRYPDATGVLVVSAIPNEFNSAFERGMTKEQCVLARALGVRDMIVAVNKMDAVGYSNEIFEKVKGEVLPFLKKLHFSHVSFVPISAYEGKNVLNILHEVRPPPLSAKVGSLACETFVDTVCVVKAQILKCENLVSAGFSCIAHIGGQEHPVTVIAIKDKVFVKSGSSCVMELLFDEKVCFASGTRIVLRTKDYTIGFCTPAKVAEGVMG